MSNALGIASVTHVLKDLLNDGLINNDVATAIGTAITVSSLPPGQIDSSNGSPTSQLNIFMYRVSYNIGWNNIGYPSRNGRGEMVNNPPLALDLHYLLTAFGEDELHSEILLGYGMQLLHENPVLVRDAINTSLSPATADNPGGRLPANLLQLTNSGLAEQIEQIKITPEPINTEEISKLWTAFQAPYRPCTAYLATVVLIESDRPVPSALPVTKRNVYAVPFRQPAIDRILSKAPSNNDAPKENRRIVIGDILVLRGHQLKSKGVIVKISGVETTPDEQNVSADEISVELTKDLNLKSGIHGVQVVQPVVVEIGTPEEREFKGPSSNLMAFVLSPEIADKTVSNVASNGSLLNADIEIEVNPGIQEQQKVVLLLNQINTATTAEPASYSFVFTANELADMTFPVELMTFKVKGIQAGDYLVRIQVDGAVSPLSTNTNGEFDAPKITIP